MNDKNCGECKHFEIDEIAAKCEKYHIICDDDAPACEHFEARVITNGDKIIAGGMRAVAELAKNRCQHCIYKKCDFDAVCFNVDCADGIEAWLNAPAESEGEDE